MPTGVANKMNITKVSRVELIEIDGRALADELFRAYLQQILIDGVFHADPHPGNVFLTSDRRLALIDLGMVGRISGAVQAQFVAEAAGLRQLRAGREQRAERAHRIDGAARREGGCRLGYRARVRRTSVGERLDDAGDGLTVR